MEKPASPELPSSMNFKPGESGRISISGLKSRGWTDNQSENQPVVYATNVNDDKDQGNAQE